MRVLILTSKIGQGHNSCARALQEAMLEDGTACVECEALGLCSREIPRLLSALHTDVYRFAPSLFRAWYRYMERPDVYICKHKGIRLFFQKSAERLYQLVTEGQYDTILCTHVISALIVTEMLRRHPHSVRTYFVCTDYTCSPGTRESCLDRYFIPDDSLRPDFVSHRIPPEKIAVGGIPVRQAFYRRTERAGAKKSFGVAPEHQHLVIMCGSMGCGPMRRLMELFDQRLSPSQEVTLVCGTNRRLCRSLGRKYAARSGIHIAGFLKDIPLLLDSADLYLTKPGGLSVTEAAAKGLPMVLLDVVAGCESYNLSFFSGLGAAVTVHSAQEAVEVSLRLLADRQRRAKMAAAFRELPRTNAARTIRSEILSGSCGAASPQEAAAKGCPPEQTGTALSAAPI